MGLIKSKITKCGYEAEYWKIIGYNVDYTYKNATITLGLYKDKESADSGVEPIETVHKHYCDGEEFGDKVMTDFSDYFGNALKSKTFGEELYTAVKQSEDLSDAKDVIEKEEIKK